MPPQASAPCLQCGMVGSSQIPVTPPLVAQPSTGSLGMLSQLHKSIPETGQELQGLGMKIQA